MTINTRLTSEGQQSGKSIKTFPVRKTGECAQIKEVVLADSSSSISGDPSGPVESMWHTVLVQLISSPSKKDKGEKLLVTQFCMKVLLPWRNRDFLLRRVPLGVLPHRRAVITTDSSLTGWRAVWEGWSFRGTRKLHWSLEHTNELIITNTYTN